MYQKLVIVGNLGGDPELRYMQDGTGVCSFSMATNRQWNNANGEKVKETTWFRVSIWGKQAETAKKYLSRGNKVLVEGTLVPDRNTGAPRLWTGQDGTVRSSFEVRGDNFRFLESQAESNASASNGSGNYAQAQGSGGGAVEEDDIPFAPPY